MMVDTAEANHRVQGPRTEPGVDTSALGQGNSGTENPAWIDGHSSRRRYSVKNWAQAMNGTPLFMSTYLVVSMSRFLVMLSRYVYVQTKKRDDGPVEELLVQMEALDALTSDRYGTSLMVVIPCLNEEENIGWVIDEVKKLVPDAPVLVIDDGSTDNTVEEASRAGAIVISNGRNRGLGFCLRNSFALALTTGYEAVVRMDGDGQHDPAFLSGLLEPLRAKQADVVIGSRYVNREVKKEDKSTSWTRRSSRKIFSGIVRLRTGQRFSDPNSGYCACSRQAMWYLMDQDLLDIPEVDMLIRLGRAGFRVHEKPVKMRPRYAGQSSVNPMKVIGYLVELFSKHFAEPALSKEKSLESAYAPAWYSMGQPVSESPQFAEMRSA